MTMFFSSEPSLPFDSIRGAIRAYPDWKMKTLEHTDGQILALKGDPDFAELWRRISNSPKEAVFPTMEAGL